MSGEELRPGCVVHTYYVFKTFGPIFNTKLEKFQRKTNLFLSSLLLLGRVRHGRCFWVDLWVS